MPFEHRGKRSIRPRRYLTRHRGPGVQRAQRVCELAERIRIARRTSRDRRAFDLADDRDASALIGMDELRRDAELRRDPQALELAVEFLALDRSSERAGLAHHV